MHYNFVKKEKTVKSCVKRALCTLYKTYINLEGFKGWYLLKINPLLKLPVFVKAECSGPVEAENKHLVAALQTLL